MGPCYLALRFVIIASTDHPESQETVEMKEPTMPYMSIREAAEEIHSGIITPTELVLETLASIDTHEHEVQAYVTVMREQALRDAEKAERELRTGLYRSPLH